MSENSIIDSLVDMGFSRENSEFAIKKVKSSNVQEIIDWMILHSNDIDKLRENELKSKSEGGESTAEIATEVKSIKCEDCGSLFKSPDEVEFHAVKSGHVNFSESTEEKTPLTEEQKREKRLLLEKMIKERRREREEKEKLDAIEREKQRIRSGKELVEAKKRLEDLEMKKMIDQRKREKIEEKLARERVKKQIEQDKLARKEKFSNHNTPLIESNDKQPVIAITNNTPNKNYNESRLMDGTCITNTFGAKEQLAAVRLYIELNCLNVPKPFLLMSTYPRREYTNEDYNETLSALGLVPSAVLFVKKPSIN